MGATWIISANASRARFFSQSASSEPLQEVHDMINDAARLPLLETSESDKRGPHAATKSIHNTGGALPNKLYEPPQTPDERENELFARDIAGFLEHAQREGSFQQLCVVASPQFLGMLRKMVPQQISALIDLEINKDYTQSSPEQLLEHVNAAKAQKREKSDS